MIVVSTANIADTSAADSIILAVIAVIFLAEVRFSRNLVLKTISVSGLLSVDILAPSVLLFVETGRVVAVSTRWFASRSAAAGTLATSVMGSVVAEIVVRLLSSTIEILRCMNDLFSSVNDFFAEMTNLTNRMRIRVMRTRVVIVIRRSLRGEVFIFRLGWCVVFKKRLLGLLRIIFGADIGSVRLMLGLLEFAWCGRGRSMRFVRNRGLLGSGDLRCRLIRNSVWLRLGKSGSRLALVRRKLGCSWGIILQLWLLRSTGSVNWAWSVILVRDWARSGVIVRSSWSVIFIMGLSRSVVRVLGSGWLFNLRRAVRRNSIRRSLVSLTWVMNRSRVLLRLMDRLVLRTRSADLRHMRSRLGRSRLAWLGLIDWLANLRDLGGLRGLRHLI